MGLFDSVYVKCPKCGERTELQAKVRCEMGKFAGENVPADIARGVDGDEFTCCGTTWRVKTPAMPRVALIVRRAGQDDDGDDSGGWDGQSFD